MHFLTSTCNGNNSKVRKLNVTRIERKRRKKKNYVWIAATMIIMKKERIFLHRIITGNEKWIYYDNSKNYKPTWVKLDEPGLSTPKRNIQQQDYAVCLMRYEECRILWATVPATFLPVESIYCLKDGQDCDFRWSILWIK